MNDEQPDECPPACNRFVALNCEKFKDCCDRGHCRYELRSILECIAADGTYGSGERNRQRAREAIRLLPQLTANKREFICRAAVEKARANMLELFEDTNWHPMFRIGVSHSISFIDNLLDEKPTNEIEAESSNTVPGGE